MNHRTLAFAALITLLAAPSAPAQGNTTLEHEIAQALERHPEVLIAKAKVAQAEGEYRLVRMRIAQEVIAKHGTLVMARANVKKLMEENAKAGGGDRSAIQAHLNDTIRQVARLEAEARFVAADATPVDAAPIAVPVRPDLPERFVQVEELSVRLEFDQATIPMIAAALSEQIIAATKDSAPLQIVVDTPAWVEELQIDEFKVDLRRPAPLTLRNALEMLADVTPLRFVVRDYGVLITTEERATYIDAATIPADLPLLGH